MTDPFASTDWLFEHLNESDIKVIDASWYLPQMERDADAEYLTAHIPGAVRFNPDEIADKSTDLPHMVANPRTFANAMGALGISETDHIVIYDGMGLFSAARVWWNLKIMGAQNVQVLSGGLPKWVAERRPTSNGNETPVPAVFRADPRTELVATVDNMRAASNDGNTQIVDARPASRFDGTTPEPRPGVRSGHIPNAINLPFPELISDGVMVDPDIVKALLRDANIDPTRPIVTSCGSGITAPILNLALATIGVECLNVYDGSWSEWGADPTLPISTSA